MTAARRRDLGVGRLDAVGVAALRRRLLLRILEDLEPRGETGPIEFPGMDALSEVLDMRRGYDRALKARDWDAVRRIRGEAQQLLADDDGRSVSA